MTNTQAYDSKLADLRDEITETILETTNRRVGREIIEPAKYIFEIGGGRGRGIIYERVHEALRGPEELRREGAVAIEMSHGASLIYNDVLDGAKKRRGEKATHLEFGMARAIGAASVLQDLSKQIIIESAQRHGRKPEEISKIGKECFNTLNSMWVAQTIDVKGKDSKNDNEFFLVVSDKNGLYSLAPKTAELITGVPDYSIHIQNFGRHLEVGHQLGDDIDDYKEDKERGNYAHKLGIERSYSKLKELRQKAKEEFRQFGEDPLVERLIDRALTPSRTLEEAIADFGKRFDWRKILKFGLGK